MLVWSAAKLLSLSVVAAINQVWLMVFGILICLLETRSVRCQAVRPALEPGGDDPCVVVCGACNRTLNNFLSRRVNKWVTENLKILTYLSGRPDSCGQGARVLPR